MKKSLLFLFVLFSIIHNAQILYDNGAIDENNSKYELDGRKWNKSNITYYFENGTNDISGDNERLAVKEAFSVWSNASNLTFTEVFSANNADIVMKWATGNHGDGSSHSFDGTNGVLAHAFFHHQTRVISQVMFILMMMKVGQINFNTPLHNQLIWSQ